MKKIFVFLLSILPFISNAQDKALDIIEKSIKAHGGKNYEKFAVELDFRQFHLILKQKNGLFHYERTMTDSNKTTWRDVLTNEGFHRERNGQKVELTKKEFDRYIEGINSQAYFLLLPYKLRDKAVKLTYLGEGEIAGQKMHKIQVSFEKEGGGEHFEDTFCYWINQKTYLIDYLAYQEGGPRFRKATARYTVSGIVFQDYENYEIPDKTLKTSDYDRIFSADGAKLLSKIEHRNIKKL